MADTTLTPDQLDQLNQFFRSASSGTQSINIGGVTYGTIGTQSTGEGGAGYQPSSLISYDPSHLKPGDSYSLIDPTTGKATGTGSWQNGGGLDGIGLLTLALITGGTLSGLGGLGGLTGSGADAGAGAGVSGLPSGAEADLFYGGGADGGATLGMGGTAGSTVPSVFNPAQDSQLANEQLGLTPADTSTLGQPNSVGGPGNTPYPLDNNGNPIMTNNGPTAPTPTGTGTNNPLPTGGGPGTGGGSGSGGGGGGGTGGMGLGDLAAFLAGLYGDHQQEKAASDMLNYLKQRQSMNDHMYDPGSPEFNFLWNQMSRLDAAAGRNSQYGPRSVDLAGKIAQMKMDANTKMTTGIGNLYANALNQKSNGYLNTLPGLMNLLGSGTGGSGLMDMINRFTNGNGTSGTQLPTVNSGSGTNTGTNSLPSGGQTGVNDGSNYYGDPSASGYDPGYTGGNFDPTAPDYLDFNPL